jgi:ribosome-associated protein
MPQALNSREKNMNVEQLLEVVLSTLEDSKAKDVTVLDVRGKTSMTDFMVVASGTSERHVKSLASHVAEEAKKHDTQPIGVEGEDVGEWVLVLSTGKVVARRCQFGRNSTAFSSLLSFVK